ncbi:TetR/AcrR family transcriptional regulator [Spirosoma spitsbergense]|uniref:TetR/AcrR family transcriptional regulator n=1 Tax=Spirosoma spitsbergense TaxID=431554 RepID=UPI0003637619|nr:TetR/AcrR family transcriptional regulator [Spirosoma spitsbergense]
MKPAELTDTEQRIKQAARQVFLRRGLDGARMQDIADEAKVDKALVHYYFRSKDKLFAIVFEEMAGRFLGQIGRVLTADVSFPEKIRLLVQHDTSMADDFPLVANFIMTELNQSQHRTNQPLTIRPLHDVQKLFVEQVNTAIEAGLIRPLNPVQLFVSLISLSLFPLVAQSLIQAILGLDGVQYQTMLTERTRSLPDFINQAIAP